MPLPETIRVKLSSEDAGYVAITPVIVREMPVRELIELMLGLTGKDSGRIHELLLRGVLVSGSSRYRWQGWDADPGGIEEILKSFPDAEPSRPFAASRCVRAVLHGAGTRIELPREVAAKRRLLRRKSYWDALIDITRGGCVQYVNYSHKERADRYQMPVSAGVSSLLRQSASALNYSSLARRIREMPIESVEFFTERVPV